MPDRHDPATDALIRALGEQYRIEGEVGRGGMGVVYLGTDVQLQRPVAIKTLLPHLASDREVRNRFLREARTAGALTHPNIVPIYAAAERDDVVYFVMRYINGESLAERIVRIGALPPNEVVLMLRQIASALHYAHASGVVHRDIKAENVLLDSETGRVMLTDFGIARVSETQPLTATGTVLGTVQYMSPEQISGDGLDGRSDLYSLGVLAFLALTARFPFERPSSAAIIVAHVNSVPPKVCSIATSVPTELGDIVDRLLLKSPTDRYADGQALRTALDAIAIDDASALIAQYDTAPQLRKLVKNAAHRDPAHSDQSNIAGLAPSEGEVMSSAEAHRIWARAAELQAHTGVVAPPAQFDALQAAASTGTAGFNAALVRASAVDAGIDARYVDRALAERRSIAATRTGTGSAATIQASSEETNRFYGAPTRVEFETSFDGELSDRGLEEAADEIRRSLSGLVNVSVVGRSLTVTATTGSAMDMPRQVQVFLTSRDGRTNVRVREDLKDMSANLFTVGAVVGGMMSLGTFFGTIAATRLGALAAAAVAATAGVAFAGTRAIYARSLRNREKELRTMMERVVARTQDSLIATSDRLRLPRKQ